MLRDGKAASLPPPQLLRATTTGRDLELNAIDEDYRSGLERMQEEFDADGILKPMEGLRAQHHFGKEGGDADASGGGALYKKMIREITRELLKNLNVEARGTMLIRYDSDAPQYLRAVLTGLDGTPYASGCFVFDIHVPADYPNQPPRCVHVTPEANRIKGPHTPGGFSPNLHSEGGKVCLSLLGTWQGPGWDPTKSNIYQLLSSIQLMILGAKHPYYMEPN